MTTPAARLRAHLAAKTCHVMPCCWDGLSAKLIEQAGFPFTFMSGFSVAAGRAGLPDTGLLSLGEILDTGRAITGAVSIPVLGDGDTGHGNALNVRRTVRQFARAGFAAVMIEDQVSPKRCGHTGVREVICRDEARMRIQAAVDVRAEENLDILILARTDARAALGLDEALRRAEIFHHLGADILFVEAPRSHEELAQIPAAVTGVHMANMLEGGLTPLLAPEELAQMGYRIAAYPLTLLSAAMKAMTEALAAMQAGRHPHAMLMDFAELKRRIGFDAHDEMAARYAPSGDMGKSES